MHLKFFPYISLPRQRSFPIPFKSKAWSLVLTSLNPAPSSGFSNFVILLLLQSLITDSSQGIVLDFFSYQNTLFSRCTVSYQNTSLSEWHSLSSHIFPLLFNQPLFFSIVLIPNATYLVKYFLRIFVFSINKEGWCAYWNIIFISVWWVLSNIR